MKISQVLFVQEKFSFQVYLQNINVKETWSCEIWWFVSTVSTKRPGAFVANVESRWAVSQIESESAEMMLLEQDLSSWPETTLSQMDTV